MFLIQNENHYRNRHDNRTIALQSPKIIIYKAIKNNMKTRQ